MATVTMYGIKNCDTIKKARRWLDEHSVDYQFHDYRTDGVDSALLQKLIKKHGWETIVNKRGTTWRKLDDTVKAATNENNAAELLSDNPSMVKRPILVIGKQSLVGFSADEYKTALNL